MSGADPGGAAARPRVAKQALWDAFCAAHGIAETGVPLFATGHDGTVEAFAYGRQTAHAAALGANGSAAGRHRGPGARVGVGAIRGRALSHAPPGRRRPGSAALRRQGGALRPQRRRVGQPRRDPHGCGQVRPLWLQLRLPPVRSKAISAPQPCPGTRPAGSRPNTSAGRHASSPTHPMRRRACARPCASGARLGGRALATSGRSSAAVPWRLPSTC